MVSDYSPPSVPVIKLCCVRKAAIDEEVLCYLNPIAAWRCTFNTHELANGEIRPVSLLAPGQNRNIARLRCQSGYLNRSGFKR